MHVGDEGPEGERPSGVQKATRALTPAWREVLERAMAPLPRDRYPEAKAMRDAIVAAMRSSGVDAKEIAREA